MDEEYVLISRGLYWLPNNAGYTGLRSSAGRYPSAVAKAHVSEGGKSLLFRDAPRFSPGCDQWIKQEVVLKDNQKLRDALMKVIRADEDFRAKLPPDWDDAPMGDAVICARETIEQCN